MVPPRRPGWIRQLTPCLRGLRAGHLAGPLRSVPAAARRGPGCTGARSGCGSSAASKDVYAAARDASTFLLGTGADVHQREGSPTHPADHRDDGPARSHPVPPPGEPGVHPAAGGRDRAGRPAFRRRAHRSAGGRGRGASSSPPWRGLCRSYVVAYYLGVPEEDRGRFEDWTQAIVQANSAGNPYGAIGALGELASISRRWSSGGGPIRPTTWCRCSWRPTTPTRGSDRRHPGLRLRHDRRRQRHHDRDCSPARPSSSPPIRPASPPHRRPLRDPQRRRGMPPAHLAGAGLSRW